VTAAAGGALLLIPLSSVLTSPIVPIPLRLLVAALWAVSLLMPAFGLLALAVVAPFGFGLIAMSGAAPIQYAESLVLATLSGLLIAAGWKAGADEPPASPSLVPPLVLFSAVVLASLAVVLTVSQLGLESHQLFLASLGTFIARDYLISGPEPWATVGAAAQLLEGGLLLVLAAHSLRRDGAASWVIRAIAAAAAIAAVTNLLALVPLLRGAESIRTIAARLLASRISVEVADVNAAGSYFAMASFVALALYQGNRQSLALRRLWALVTAVLFVALWLTGSRTALVCVVVLMGMAIAATRTPWRERSLWPIAAGVVVMAVAAALVIGVDPRAVAGRSLERSFESRAAFLTTGLRMIASAPAFGVGVGRYIEESGRFMPSSIYWFFFRENAHNNFLQVGGELGLIGLAAFIWLIAAGAVRLARGIRAGGSDRLLRGAAAGLAAFVATWLTGHPLLTPEVAIPFWVLAGAAVARADGNRSAHLRPHLDSPRTVRRLRLVYTAAIVLLAASVPLRARQDAARLNTLDNSFGFYEWESRPGRGRTRWASPSAAFFVPAETSEVEIPVRTMFSSRQRRPAAVSIAIDGRVFDRFELRNDDWKDVRLRLPPSTSHPAQPRRIDIVTSPSWSLAELFGTRSSRALGVQLGEVTTR
jgi:O-antigen ligase